MGLVNWDKTTMLNYNVVYEINVNFGDYVFAQLLLTIFTKPSV